MENRQVNKKRSFSVELKSKAYLKNFALNGEPEGVLIEGVLGELERAGFAEGLILEVVGSNGVLRVDIGEGEIEKAQLKAEPEAKQQ